MIDRKARDVPVVSYKTLQMIKKHLKNPAINELSVSLDLNISQSTIQLFHNENAFQLPNGESISFPKLFKPNKKVCYAIFDGQIHPMKFYNPETELYYKLVPTSFRPILRISATQMHKKPFLDYLETIELTGCILDGGTGLGYSAIIASFTASRVYTVEWDSNVIEIATYNPHSKSLFTNPKIELRNADITSEIITFNDQFFDNIIQDGGTPKSSGNFFSQSHCYELFRVLKSGGNLLIYLPRHGISKGRDFGHEHIHRLENAGFILQYRDVEGSFAHLRKYFI